MCTASSKLGDMRCVERVWEIIEKRLTFLERLYCGLTSQRFIAHKGLIYFGPSHSQINCSKETYI